MLDTNSTPLPWLVAALSLAVAAGCSGNESTSNAAANGSTSEQMDMAPECSPGDAGCACYGNGTCNAEFVCTDSICTDPDCPVGSLTCACYGNNTCNDGLSCQDGACAEAVIDEPDLPAAELDMAPDMAPEPDMRPECVPETMCPEDACGQLDDGCGGTLECTPCECVDGAVAIEPSCGHCGLGRTTCEPGTSGPSTCTMPEAQGLDWERVECTSIVYVDIANQGGNESGSETEPFASLETALRHRASQSLDVPYLLMVRAGSETLESGLEIPDHTVVLGGLDARWHPSAQKTSLASAGTILADEDKQVGLLIQDIENGVWVSGVQLSLAPLGGRAHTSVGVLVRDSSARVWLAHLDVTAAPGADGEDGIDGIDGADGESGPNADNPLAVDAPDRPTPGTALDPPSGATCAGTKGGQGGYGAYATNPRRSIPEAGHASDGGVPGGSAATDPAITAVGEPGVNAATWAAVSPTAPADGLSGVAVDHLGEMTVIGNHSAWVHKGDGSSGEDGEPGWGGGGGAGGTQVLRIFDFVSYPGGSGGAGGNGGCSGTGGTGGGMGGSSIGLLVLEAPDTVITSSSFTSKVGGDGGKGGAGGNGGMGAAGGAGTTQVKQSDGSLDAHSGAGGQGGRGMNGKDGGDGAGGQGGHSLGAWCSHPVDYDQATQFLTLSGGSGGNSAVPGLPGQATVSCEAKQ